MTGSGNAYASAEAANVNPLAEVQKAYCRSSMHPPRRLGRPLIGSGLDGTAANPDGGAGGLLIGNGVNGFNGMGGTAVRPACLATAATAALGAGLGQRRQRRPRRQGGSGGLLFGNGGDGGTGGPGERCYRRRRDGSLDTNPITGIPVLDRYWARRQPGPQHNATGGGSCLSGGDGGTGGSAGCSLVTAVMAVPAVPVATAATAARPPLSRLPVESRDRQVQSGSGGAGGAGGHGAGLYGDGARAVTAVRRAPEVSGAALRSDCKVGRWPRLQRVSGLGGPGGGHGAIGGYAGATGQSVTAAVYPTPVPTDTSHQRV
ncbi:hypothetical protein [Mycobacterium riyadhense]|uniref:hypothetical protein n=1 Tax=Mycobacterium riyadhense TaxID=486698 RepID=UPI0023BB1055|nr:hypothetical protein [Mycobacterium riyadhense]